MSKRKIIAFLVGFITYGLIMFGYFFIIQNVKFKTALFTSINSALMFTLLYTLLNFILGKMIPKYRNRNKSNFKDTETTNH